MSKHNTRTVICIVLYYCRVIYAKIHCLSCCKYTYNLPHVIHALFYGESFFLFRCTCGNCNVDLLVKGQEAQCCQEIEGYIEALKADLVVKEVGFVPHCITLHPGFDSVCLAPWSLRQAGRKFRKLDERKYTIQNDENR